LEKKEKRKKTQPEEVKLHTVLYGTRRSDITDKKAAYIDV